MKKFLFAMMAMLMSFGASSFAGTTTMQNHSQSVQKISIPAKLILKQVITFKDGKTVEVFYQKDGNICKLYSNTDITKYKKADLNNIKSTNIEVADHIEGKCIMTKKTSDVLSLAKNLLKQLE